MTDPNGLSEAILLRLADRIFTLEQQNSAHATEIHDLKEHVTEIRGAVGNMSRDVENVRQTSADAIAVFEQMRKPLQGLLDLRQRFTGAWLVVTALLMAAAYLFQPLLLDLYHWHAGGR